MKRTQILDSQTPSNFRIAPQSPSPRTWRINQDARKFCKEGKRKRPIELNDLNSTQSQSLNMLLDRAKPVRVPVRSHNDGVRPRSPSQRRGLPAWRRAQIQHRISSRYIEQQRHHLRSLILNRSSPLAKLRRLRQAPPTSPKRILQPQSRQNVQSAPFHAAHNFIPRARIVNHSRKLGRPIVRFQKRNRLRLAESPQPSLH